MVHKNWLHLNIPPVVMGTTVLAAGIPIPDALSSIAVAKAVLANMAVATPSDQTCLIFGSDLGLAWLCYLSWQTPNYLTVTTDELFQARLF